MINKVLTVGCSFTYGDELKTPTSQAWPILLANKNNWEVNNLGKCGGSNDRIQQLMAQSMEASRKLNEIMQRAIDVNEATK